MLILYKMPEVSDYYFGKNPNMYVVQVTLFYDYELDILWKKVNFSQKSKT